jgi:hypothetical protein
VGRDSGRLVGIGLRAEVDLIVFLVVSLLGMRSFGEIYVRVNALVRICSGAISGGRSLPRQQAT